MAHPAESTHWYGRTGLPAYTVTGLNGKERPTTLRDARKQGLAPSTTTIIRSAAAPALERWKVNQGILAALTLPRKEGESDEAYLARVVQDSKEQARKAAEKGTAIHAAIQGDYEDAETPPEYAAHVIGAAAVVEKHTGWHDWTPERSFYHPLGYGGKVDLSCDGWVIDFKTKEYKPEDDLKAWDEHAMQLAAYREGLGQKHDRCAIVYVSTLVPGLANVIPIGEDELQRGWAMFQGLLAYWKAKAGYRPEEWTS